MAATDDDVEPLPAPPPVHAAIETALAVLFEQLVGLDARIAAIEAARQRIPPHDHPRYADAVEQALDVAREAVQTTVQQANAIRQAMSRVDAVEARLDALRRLLDAKTEIPGPAAWIDRFER